MWEKKKKLEEVQAVLGKGAEFIGKLIFDGAVRIDGTKVEDKALKISSGSVLILQVGKRKFAKITVK